VHDDISFGNVPPKSVGYFPKWRLLSTTFSFEMEQQIVAGHNTPLALFKKNAL
jgi:hypothetical protein